MSGRSFDDALDSISRAMDRMEEDRMDYEDDPVGREAPPPPMPDPDTQEGRRIRMQRLGEFVCELLSDQPKQHPTLFRNLVIRESIKLDCGAWIGRKP